MDKKIIGFKLIDVAHTTENIADSIIKVMEDFGLVNKIFSITIDNSTGNSKAMDILTPVFNTYVTSQKKSQFWENRMKISGRMFLNLLCVEKTFT